MILECENGYIVIPSYDSAMAFSPEGKEIIKFGEGGDHFANFVDACRSRNHADLHADIEEGHKSTRLCHLGNIAYRTGKTLHFDEKTESFPKEPDANVYLGREYRKGFELPKI